MAGPHQDPIRIAKYIKARKSGKNKSQSAIVAGVPPGSASPTASRLEKLPEVKTALAAAIRKKGINEDRLANVLDAGLNLNPGSEQLGYFKEAKECLGYAKSNDADAPQQSILNIIIALNEARAAGIIPPGPVIEAEAQDDDAA